MNRLSLFLVEVIAVDIEVPVSSRRVVIVTIAGAKLRVSLLFDSLLVRLRCVVVRRRFLRFRMGRSCETASVSAASIRVMTCFGIGPACSTDSFVRSFDRSVACSLTVVDISYHLLAEVSMTRS